LRYEHYQKYNFNDDLSSKVLDNYLETLDGARLFFTAADIAEFEDYRHTLDNALLAGDLTPAYHIYNRYQQRRSERLAYLIKNLDNNLKNLDFNKNESIETDRENAPWAKDSATLDKLWKKRLKDAILSLKHTGKTQEEAIEKLSRRYQNQINQIDQIKSEDVFQAYMNAVTQAYDPHTTYFSPRKSKNFDINMSLSLEGIGALLQSEDEYTKIVRVIPAGPADKSKLLKAEDRIIGVGQGKKGEIVDVIGWRLDDVVDRIRGPKDSTVRLEIIPADAVDDHQTKIIELVRNTIKLEDQSAQKEIIEIERDGRVHKIGIIEIPTFYIDFEALRRGDKNYKSTTSDVKRLLKELVNEKVEGVVIDLRNNGGGSLREANELTGLFIKYGPTVQIQDARGRVDILRDPDPRLVYDGPLAVLVNRLSASASEIFAGAIQDYRRGIIIGGQTFGKGTVQTLTPLNHGQLKITQAKFYRISGDSTQNHGVHPDVLYPTMYNLDEVGESALEDALPWDRIKAARYRPTSRQSPANDLLNRRHLMRVKENPDYIYLLEQINHLEKIRDDSVISLLESVRKQEREAAEKWQLDTENRRRIAKGKEIFKDYAALKEYRKKLTDPATDKKDHEEPDFLLEESGEILLDQISLSQQSLAVLR
ncbi:MAG TPA: tail-specific protease, partial [Gammaproteobacteria bacterium]|nr:tail-specific protease [Gammaproteobacteria bacterium]